MLICIVSIKSVTVVVVVVVVVVVCLFVFCDTCIHYTCTELFYKTPKSVYSCDDQINGRRPTGVWVTVGLSCYTLETSTQKRGGPRRVDRF